LRLRDLSRRCKKAPATTTLDDREKHVPRKPVKTSKARPKAAARPSVRKAAPAQPRVPTEHDRFDYSAIIDRPRLSWPDGARVAVWVIPNIEHFLFDRPSTRLTNLPVNPTCSIIPGAITACASASGG
jgi:hypothetical protein